MYRTVDVRFWTDPKVSALDPHGKLLLLYLITNPQTHLSGIYHLPSVLVELQCGIPYRRGIDTLSSAGIAHFDPLTETVWVVNMFHYQASGPKAEKSAATQLQALHKSCLRNAFVAHYPAVGRLVPEIEPIPYRYPIDTPSIPLPTGTGTGTESGAGTETSPEPELPAEEVLVEIPTAGNRAPFQVTASFLRQYEESYPGVDLLAACRKARAWGLSNPTRRKTARGMPKHLNVFFERAQNEQPGRTGPVTAGQQTLNALRVAAQEDGLDGGSRRQGGALRPDYEISPELPWDAPGA